MVQLAVVQPQTLESVKLTLRNPSPYGRAGLIVTPWQPVSDLLGGPSHVGVFRDYDGTRVPLTAQIDRLDPSDPSRDELVFALDHDASRGDDDYTSDCGAIVVEPAAPQQVPTGPRVNALYDGVQFTNQRLRAWLNTSTTHDSNDNPWFGGAMASIRWDDQELLDPIADDLGFEHDPDKRSLQIDRIHLVRAPWDETGSFDWFLFDKPWRTVAVNEGPLRATATIVSWPFDFKCRDVDQDERTFKCTVHRALSIFNDSDVITEKLWVRADADGPTPAVDLWFSARYFMLVNLSLETIQFRYPDHPGWFAMVAEGRPRHGYAFATDAYAGPIWHPPLEHKDPDTAHRAYSWELGATREANSAHIFRRDTTTQRLTDAIGWTWYDLVFKPLRATI
jgi:hypothetical protein